MRPSPAVTDTILLQIQSYYESVQKSTHYNEAEKAELLNFLRSQLNSWGLLGDNLKSDAVTKYKQKILINTWRKFAAEMKIYPQHKPKQQKGNQAEKNVEKGLEEEPSTSGTLVQGDVQVLVGDNEAAVGSHEPVGQTISHHQDHVQEKKPVKSDQKI